MRRRLLIAGSLLLLGCGVAGLWSWSIPASESELLKEARELLTRRQYAEAETQARQVLIRNPESVAAALLAARAAAAMNRDEAAFAYLADLKPNDRLEAADVSVMAGEISYRLGRAADAEKFLSQAVELDRGLVRANNELAYLLGLEGRAWESFNYLTAAIQQGEATTHHLVMLGAVEPVVLDEEFVAKCRQAVPDDPIPLLGIARSALVEYDWNRAEPILRDVVAAKPRLWEGQAQFGKLLLMQRAEPAFLEWNARLPAEARHPEIWVVRGHWAKSRSETQVAARCYWEALRLEPSHRVANYQLGLMLRELNRMEQAEPFLDRASRLEKLNALVDRIYDNPEVASLQLDAARLTGALGRPWEAWGWARAALKLQPNLVEARKLMDHWRSQLRPETPRVVPEADLARAIDLSGLPLPNWPAPRVEPSQDIHADNAFAEVAFADVAASVGMNFTYFNGHDPQLEGTRMLESIGGGVAVLDYDNDGWPDVYFTQGTRWPHETDRGEHVDVLFRNLGNGSFAEVTGATGLDDANYSQGCTVGDFDNDGFPDLYVANIGENRLFRNQGDGTFWDITSQSGIAGKLWTTSCLMADLNGDGHPDIFDVNYLSIQDAPRTMCLKGQEARSCGPGAFAAEPDQIYLNLGQGEFQNVTESSGIAVPDGKGLGIVAADFTGTGRLNLFVANDAVPNFYFVNQTESRGGALRFREQAIASGLAVNREGLSQACMGVAAGDADGDGRLDLHVTNYAGQTNSLFQQDAGGLFSDVVMRSGLAGPSYPMLGFGTQFLDGELDGHMDLVVANGHVFDLRDQGTPYQMRPQYYRNLGQAKFVELPAKELGAFFQGAYLGRGLARIDWNRDGREDFVVSQINSPASLVTNQTASPGTFLAVRLVGVTGSRDAIGASLTLRVGEQTWTRQLTAGDGFQASNERKVIFGLGRAERIDELQVRWPAGGQQTFRDLPYNAEVLLIEGRPTAITLPRAK